MKQSSSNEMAEERNELKFEGDTGHECPLPKKPKVPIYEFDLLMFKILKCNEFVQLLCSVNL